MTRRTRTLLTGLWTIALFAPAATAHAFWHALGSGIGAGTAATMPAGNEPTAAVSGQSVTLSWDQSSFLGSPLGTYAGGGYTIMRYAAGNSTSITPAGACSTTISGSATTLQCSEAGVPYGSWRYAVTPVLNTFTGAQSAMSAALDVVTAAAVLGSVTAQNPTAAQTTGDLHLAWAAVSGATGYNVYRRTAGGSFDFGSPLNGATPISATAYADAGSGLAAGTTYHYVVRAVAGSPTVEAASSNALSAAPISRPAAPTGVTAVAAAAARVDVAWSSVAGVAGYNVYRRTAAGAFDYAAPLNGATPVSATAYADLTAVNATTYHYAVRAVISGAGAAQVESASSDASDAVTADATPPDAPSVVSVTNGHVLAAARCNIVAGTRFVNNASRTAVAVSATLAAPEPGATVHFSATTPTSTAVVGSASAAATTTATLNLASLADGVLTLTAYSRDAAGNASAPRSMTAAVRKDVVFTPALTIDFSSGILGVGARIYGNAECGADVVATKGSNVRTVTVAPGATTWEIGVSGLLASSGWTATATDPAGNTAGPVED